MAVFLRTCEAPSYRTINESPISRNDESFIQQMLIFVFVYVGPYLNLLYDNTLPNTDVLFEYVVQFHLCELNWCWHSSIAIFVPLLTTYIPTDCTNVLHVGNKSGLDYKLQSKDVEFSLKNKDSHVNAYLLNKMRIEQAHIVVLWLPSNPLNSEDKAPPFWFPLSVNHRPFWPPDDIQLRNKIQNLDLVYELLAIIATCKMKESKKKINQKSTLTLIKLMSILIIVYIKPISYVVDVELLNLTSTRNDIFQIESICSHVGILYKIFIDLVAYLPKCISSRQDLFPNLLVSA
ncbi:hypothetical protein AGLY_009631 [Aphis glycines]|uniref:Uncharacterized protein n=1 Tax=Aphis glycines TaxID=307491 RepID=A0A6G0TGK2_APHGL|nr:hypothetical protein AGLY_009631 [Aphis glycines]